MNTRRKALVKISYLGDNFREWFLEKVEEPRAETTLRYAKLLRPSTDDPIIGELGGEEKAETMLSHVSGLMALQPDKEAGALLTDGQANIFYIYDVNGVLRAVSARWLDGGWHVRAYPVEYPFRWLDDVRVFSRNS